METLSRYRGYVILTLLYAIAFGGYLLYERRPQPEPIEIIHPTATLAVTVTPGPIQVHVVGAVREPGVYLLAPGSRLSDAVEAAGGMTADSDPVRVNLADYIRDAQQINIPRVGTPLPPSPTPMGATGRSGAIGIGLGIPININMASAAELQALPGIGPTYAERIVAYREAHGPFTAIDQIMQVNGIGRACFEQIRAQITVE